MSAAQLVKSFSSRSHKYRRPVGRDKNQFQENNNLRRFPPLPSNNVALELEDDVFRPVNNPGLARQEREAEANNRPRYDAGNDGFQSVELFAVSQDVVSASQRSTAMLEDTQGKIPENGATAAYDATTEDEDAAVRRPLLSTEKSGRKKGMPGGTVPNLLGAGEMARPQLVLVSNLEDDDTDSGSAPLAPSRPLLDSSRQRRRHASAPQRLFRQSEFNRVVVCVGCGNKHSCCNRDMEEAATSHRRLSAPAWSTSAAAGERKGTSVRQVKKAYRKRREEAQHSLSLPVHENGSQEQDLRYSSTTVHGYVNIPLAVNIAASASSASNSPLPPSATNGGEEARDCGRGDTFDSMFRTVVPASSLSAPDRRRRSRPTHKFDGRVSGVTSPGRGDLQRLGFMQNLSESQSQSEDTGFGRGPGDVLSPQLSWDQYDIQGQDATGPMQ